MEMASLTQNSGQFAQQSDPNAILNACRDMDAEIAKASNGIQALAELTVRVNGELDQANIARELDQISAFTMAQFEACIKGIARIKRMPDSGSSRNGPQIKRVQRKLKDEMALYKTKESQFNNTVRDQMRREYRIVNANATQAEVEQAVPNAEPQQMFQQALMQSNRQGQANTTLNAVRQRNEAIKKIEQDIIQIAQMFQEMEEMVVQQEAAVVQIEQKGEEVVDNMDKGNVELDTGIKSAKARNRKKWWCLGISRKCLLVSPRRPRSANPRTVAIIAVIVIVILIYKFVINKTTTTTTGHSKRALQELSRRVVMPGVGWVERGITPDLADLPFSNDIVRKVRTFVA